MKIMNLGLIIFKLSQKELDAYCQRAEQIIQKNFNTARKKTKIGKTISYLQAECLATQYK